MISYIAEQDIIKVKGTAFSPTHTFECGQCFRFGAGGDDMYTGVAYGKAVTVWKQGDLLCFDCSEEDFLSLWRDYFDLRRDYDAISRGFPGDSFTREAISFGRGLHILRQQPWEALCSFIISQCNNIPRIKKIVDTLCRTFGEEIIYKGQSLFTFPSAKALCGLSPTDLDMLRAGYRSAYILSAARAVASGEVDFDALMAMDSQLARAEITRLDGVGRKVADCFLLFGLGKLDAFPVDTWMKKAAAFYPGGFPQQQFGRYAGVAQQYIFYYARSKKVGG